MSSPGPVRYPAMLPIYNGPSNDVKYEFVKQDDLRGARMIPCIPYWKQNDRNCSKQLDHFVRDDQVVNIKFWLDLDGMQQLSQNHHHVISSQLTFRMFCFQSLSTCSRSTVVWGSLAGRTRPSTRSSTARRPSFPPRNSTPLSQTMTPGTTTGRPSSRCLVAAAIRSLPFAEACC